MNTNIDTTDIQSLSLHSAKKIGYHEQREMLEKVLLAMYDGANDTFWKQREGDAYYADPRTDYLLGKRDAISDLLAYMRKTMTHYGETIHLKGDN